MARHDSERSGNRTLPLYAIAVLLVLVGAVTLAAYTVELGIAKPGENARRVAVAVAEVDATLQGEPSFLEFSESLYAALAARRALAVRNPADNRISHAVDGALDCYTALRESWQMELEGAWDPAMQGDPAYWRSFHAAVRLPSAGPLDAAELREMLRDEALAYANEALALAER